MAMPLPAGRYIGQRKLIRMIGGASTPIANVSGNFTTDGVATTQAQFNAAADQLGRRRPQRTFDDCDLDIRMPARDGPVADARRAHRASRPGR